MKRFAILLAALCVLLPSCKKDDEPKADKTQILIKVTIPENTQADDNIYIVGPLTGGDAFSVGNPQWKLTRSGSNCNILLEPEGFIGGKTLADGFWFASEKKGREVGADGKEVTRTLSAKTGKEYQFVVAAWKD